MKIGIAFDLAPTDPALRSEGPDDRFEEFDKPETVEAIAQVIRGEGHEVVLLGDGREFLIRILDDPPDFVFNIAEGEGVGRSREARVPAALEMLGIPYSGSDPLTLAASLDKDMAKTLVKARGVKVPLGTVWPAHNLYEMGLKMPVIIKPAFEGSSKGIRGHCLVEDFWEIIPYARRCSETYGQQVIIEEFIEGDEVTVGILSRLPYGIETHAMRILPSETKERFIYSLEVKRDWKNQVRYETPAHLEPEDFERIRSAAIEAYEALGCRDFARIDFRVREGVPYFIEANPLPGLAPGTSDLVILAEGHGIGYSDLIRRILHASLTRVGLKCSRRRLKVAVLFNAPSLPTDHPDSASEADVLEVARVVAEGLVRQGFDAWPLPARPPVGKALGQLENPAPDVVFNLIEGFGGSSGGEAHVTGLLELLGLPYTGCPPEAQSLCHSKARTKALLKGMGLPTAPFALVRSGEPIPRWAGPWPVILKPEAEDASLGIDQQSVARTPEAIVEGVARLRVSHGADVLIEAYLPGREFNVGLLAMPEPEACPVAEIIYNVAEGLWPILTYAAKWAEGSLEDLASRPRCPAEVEPNLARSLASLAVEAFRATGCRDYARVNFRLDADGSPMILEVNPNPDIGPKAGWARALHASGREYEATLASLVHQAKGRRAGHGLR